MYILHHLYIRYTFFEMFEEKLLRVRVADLRPSELFYLGKLMLPCVVCCNLSRSVKCKHGYDDSFFFTLDNEQYVFVRLTSVNAKLPL